MKNAKNIFVKTKDNQSKKKYSFHSSIFIILFVLTGMVFSCGQPKNKNQALESKIDVYTKKVMKKFDIPGMTIAVTQDGNTIYTGAFGVRNLNTKDPMKAEYIFHQASVSKPFTAAAVMQLAEQGKIDLDERLIKYLPYFKLADGAYKEITIRQMLTHTSGMPAVRDYEWDKPQYDDGAAERYVRSLVKEKMIFAPGERFRYSNMAYDVLADVIAKVSGQPFEIYVKENILNPLGMKESSFLIKEIPESLRTTPHIWRIKPVVCKTYPYNRRHAPSSTLNASVVEMVNWAEANLNRGVLNGRRILKAESYDLMWKPYHKAFRDYQIGLSWFLGERHGLKTVSHGGGDTGYRSYCLLVPEKKLGILLASNYDRTPNDKIVDGILDIILDHKPVLPKIGIAQAFAEVYTKSGIDSAKAFYHRVFEKSADEYKFGPGELNHLGYSYLSQKKIKEAVAVFLFNTELYPGEANPWDSLAEAYMTAGQNEPAVKYYKKSLELNPDNTNAVQMLEKLRRK